MIRTALVSFAALGLFAAASAETVETFQTEFSYTAELLEVRAGADVVLDEIERQARAACKGDFDWRIAEARLEAACVEGMVIDAVAQIDNGFLYEASTEAGYDVVTQVAAAR